MQRVNYSLLTSTAWRKSEICIQCGIILSHTGFFSTQITNLNILLLRLSANMPNIEYLSLLGNPACPDQLSAAGPETTNNPQDDYQHYRFVHWALIVDIIKYRYH